MNVLLIGSGGREHAIAWKLAESPLLERLYAAPGNPGIGEHARLVALDPDDHAGIIAFCHEHRITLVVVGPEAPLVGGLADALTAAGIACFGPSAAAARLEGSKSFTKELCARQAIPTAGFARFDRLEPALAYLEGKSLPIVIKADGLAAGKGVTIATSHAQADAALKDCFTGAFGNAGAAVVIEDFLEGEEASFFCLCDGKTALPLATAQDHKRAFDGDRGPNTGGMGAYSPAPVMTPEIIEATMRQIIEPTMAGMAALGAPFTGVLYAGLMITGEGPKLIEYNVRFGDPEAQVLMMRLDDDLLELIKATTDGMLSQRRVHWQREPALSVVMATQGYPGAYRKGSPIRGLDIAADVPGVKIFQAGTAIDRDGRLIAAGGRVLAVTAIADTVEDARARVYGAIDRIDWPQGFCRGDIGWRAITTPVASRHDETG